MINPLPTPPQSTDPANFEARADAFMEALPTFTDEVNATAAAMNLNSTTDASTTSLAIGTGAKTFTVSLAKSFQPGMYLVAADAAAPSTNSMFGQITSYDVATGALILNVLTVRGSGTKAAWVISQSSAGGAVAGPLATSGITGAAASGANSDITSLKIGVQGTFTKFTADAIGVNNYNCVITAAGVVLKNSVDQYLSVKSVSLTINANGTVGAPLSIMSSRASSTWYYRWIWYNATLGVTATLDTSSSAPTAPTGYASTDFNALMPGACRTDASGSTYLLQTKTRGKNSSYTVLAGSNTAALRVMASGALGDPTTPTWSAVAVGAFVPPTATAITAVLSTDTTNVLAIVAPSNAYGGRSSASNLPPMTMNSYLSAAGVGSSLTMELESTNIYYASSGAAYLLVSGWRDEV